MDTAILLENIEARLAELNISADAASKRAGKPDAIRNLRRYVEGKSKRTWTLDTLQAIAAALQTEPWLLLKPRGTVILDGDARTAIKALIREEISDIVPPPATPRRRAG